MGGQGVSIEFLAAIGDGPFELRPGRPIRFIVGERGEHRSDLRDFGDAAGGGGGGTAVVYRAADSGGDTQSGRNGWEIMAVAGGGGGASSASEINFCESPNQDGVDAETGWDGGDTRGTNRGGGTDGFGGEGVNAISGGGGGVFGGGTHEVEGDDARAGLSGFFNGDPVGGLGGETPDTNGGNGGFGFGSGGAGGSGSGGGGGGYSGGGSKRLNRGGDGGGSFVNAAYTLGDELERNSPSGSSGFIAYQVESQTHDEAGGSLPVQFDADGNIDIRGLVIGATESVLQGIGSPGRDVWYFYRAPAGGCSEVVRLQFGGGITIAATTADLSVIDASAAGLLEVRVSPGETVYFRVGSFSESFIVTGSVTDADSDADGVCDELDMCAGVDDALVDTAADVDNDGIPDVCDQACPEDVWPDGEFTDFDVSIYGFLVANADPDSLPTLDFDESGEVDYFDWVEVFDWCD